MQAIILAAGMGTRLRPYTDEIPKALVPVQGMPLIKRMISVLSDENIKEVIIVIGYQGEKIKQALGFNFEGVSITYVENQCYATTNNSYSLLLTKEYITDDTLLLECDLYIKGETIHCLCNTSSDCAILVSPYNAKTMDGTIVVLDKENIVKELVIKRFQEKDFDYKSSYKTVNIYKFKREFIVKKFFPALELFVKTQNMSSYYEVVLGSLIYFHNDDITAVKIKPSLWCEIDSPEDLQRAEKSEI